MTITGPILVVNPVPYNNPEVYWARDMGLLTRGLRGLGVEATLVAPGRPGNHPSELPLVLGTAEDLQNPAWWQALKPWGIVFLGWGASRFNGIRRAALTATPRMIEKLDTDGVRSPRTWFRKYAVENYTLYRDSDRPWKRTFAPLLSALHILAAYWLLDRRIAEAMNQMPALAAESPLAIERIRRFLRRYSDKPPRMFCLPHPVDESFMRFESGVARENRVISVGRWPAYQKNFPLLLKVLTQFLQEHPNWQADVVGRLPAGWQPDDRFAASLRGRFHFHGLKSNREVSAICQRSKIFFLASRCEGFNIAAAEALCCGCSVVGPAEFFSVFTGNASGTVACRQRGAHFLDALGAEVWAWDNGQRKPELISQKWQAEVGLAAVSRKTLACLQSLQPLTAKDNRENLATRP